MNDLERDLHELFDQRSRDVDPAVLAPAAVIRRGHRRQARTAVGGVLAGVVVIAIAVAAVGSIQRSDGVTPAGTQRPAGARDAHRRRARDGAGRMDADRRHAAAERDLDVHRSRVRSAPAGRRSTRTGRPWAVRTGAGAILGLHVGAADLPAGVPFLQLANFELPLMESVCDWGEGSVASLPADGVAIYVAAFPNGVATSTLLDACPGAEQYAVAGENAYTFGLTTQR